MRKKLVLNGDDWLMSLDDTFFELINISPEKDDIEVSIENSLLTITKMQKKGLL